MLSQRGIILWCFCLASLGCATIAVAQQVPWRSDSFQAVAVDQPIPELLRSFAADQGVLITVDESVVGNVSGQFGPASPDEFLNYITRANGLVWYFDGHSLFVTRSDTLQSMLIPVRSITLDEALASLNDLGLLSKQFPIQKLEERGILRFVGPARYLAEIQNTLASLETAAREQANIDIVVRIFPLRYAWADDQTLNFAGSQVIVPGVATILRNVLTAEGGQPGALRGRVVTNNRQFNDLPGLRGRGLINPRFADVRFAQEAAVNAEAAAARAEAIVETQNQQRQFEQEQLRQQQQSEREAAGASLPAAIAEVQGVIQADPRLNAIIVRDIEEKMPYYSRIIQQLDIPGGLVHIEAKLIDVNADSGLDWGLPYLFQYRNGNQNYQLQLSLDQNTANPLGAANLGFSLMRNQVNEFLGQVQALETDGHARIVSKPSVLTINNVEAFLDSTEEFFVRVNGNQEVDLFNVTLGTTLRIVPHIVNEPMGRRVKLIVQVSDGVRTADTVDGIPVVTRNNINTQAVLAEGSSLLIGGLMREEETKSERRIPGLGRLRNIGWLFKEIDNEKRKMERMVLITPTIIDVPTACGNQCNPSGTTMPNAIPLQEGESTWQYADPGMPQDTLPPQMPGAQQGPAMGPPMLIPATPDMPMQDGIQNQAQPPMSGTLPIREDLRMPMVRKENNIPDYFAEGHAGPKKQQGVQQASAEVTPAAATVIPIPANAAQPLQNISTTGGTQAPATPPAQRSANTWNSPVSPAIYQENR